MLEALDRVLHSDFLSHNDNVFRDLTIDRALELNDDIEIQPNVYYFSYAGDKTRQSTLTGERTSAVDMTPLFVPFANQMCGYYDQTTAGGFQIDKSCPERRPCQHRLRPVPDRQHRPLPDQERQDRLCPAGRLLQRRLSARRVERDARAPL